MLDLTPVNTLAVCAELPLHWWGSTGEERTSLSLSSSQALELIKSVITQPCVCLLLQIPELDKSFQGCSPKCHVISRAADIWVFKGFVFAWIWQFKLLPSLVFAYKWMDVFFVVVCLSVFVVVFSQWSMSSWSYWSGMVRCVVQNPVRGWFRKCRDAVVQRIIIPSFIKIQSAETWIHIWHIWQIEKGLMGVFAHLFLCFSFLNLFSLLFLLFLWIGCQSIISSSCHWGVTAGAERCEIIPESTWERCVRAESIVRKTNGTDANGWDRDAFSLGEWS